MEQLRLADYVIEYDRPATLSAYNRLAIANVYKCTCSICRNFAMQRGKFKTAELLALFSTLGIDGDQEIYLFNYGKDPSTGLYRYAGWYPFVGLTREDGSMQHFGDFSFRGGTEFPELPAAFKSESQVAAIDFMMSLPWSLNEPQRDPA